MSTVSKSKIDITESYRLRAYTGFNCVLDYVQKKYTFHTFLCSSQIRRSKPEVDCDKWRHRWVFGLDRRGKWEPSKFRRGSREMGLNCKVNRATQRVGVLSLRGPSG